MRTLFIPAGQLIAALACLLIALPLHAEPSRPEQGPMGERELTISNRSDRAINEIYISAKSADTWGTDRLEDSTLAVGASSRIKLGRTRDCLFDVQILYEDATREDHLAVDLCRTRLLAVDGRNATPLAGMSRAPHVITVQNGDVPENVEKGRAALLALSR